MRQPLAAPLAIPDTMYCLTNVPSLPFEIVEGLFDVRPFVIITTGYSSNRL
jgi:hypothetical protein